MHRMSTQWVDATGALISRYLLAPPFTFAPMQLQNYIAGQWGRCAEDSRLNDQVSMFKWWKALNI